MASNYIEVLCPIGAGTKYRRADLKHPRLHSISLNDARTLLESLGEDDYEDGPRCILEVLKEIKEYGKTWD